MVFLEILGEFMAILVKTKSKTEKNFDDKNRQVVNNAVITVENRMQVAILTIMDNLIIAPFEMALIAIFG